MSGILFCKCTNKNCDFEPHLSWGVPVWADHVPKELRKVPNSTPGAIIEKLHTMICTNCRDYVNVAGGTYVCPKCSSARTLTGVGGKCPKCNEGIIEDTEMGPIF